MNIKTSSGKVFIIDREDYKKVSLYKWHISSHGYVKRDEWNGKNRKVVYLHRYILEINNTKSLVDHVNGDKLDNRKSNLRLCNRSQNACNSKLSKNNSSGYKGVRKKRKKWQAYFKFNGKQKSIGVFETKQEAALAYNKKVLAVFGEFAKLNIIK